MPSPVARTSLVAQTAQALRTGIGHGEYEDYLLPERALSAELGVSRPTLRAALLLLQKEGLLSVKDRKIRRILHPQRQSEKRTVVRLLQDSGPASLFNEHLKVQAYLAEHLRGTDTEFHIDTAPSVFAGHPERALERLIQSRPAHLWLLYRTTAPIQRWFQKGGLSCVILGSCHPGVNFTSIDEDYRAICRHAAGLLLAKRHRRLALLTPKPEMRRPGDQASIEGFQEGVARSSEEKIDCRVVSHDTTVAGICQAVDQVMMRPKPPTGWLIMHAPTYLTVSSHLARQGIAVGRDVSLICRNSDPYLGALVPTAAHYQRNMRMMNHRLIEIIHQTLIGQAPVRQRWLIGSEFKDGESLQALSPS